GAGMETCGRAAQDAMGGGCQPRSRPFGVSASDARSARLDPSQRPLERLARPERQRADVEREDPRSVPDRVVAFGGRAEALAERRAPLRAHGDASFAARARALAPSLRRG